MTIRSKAADDFPAIAIRLAELEAARLAELARPTACGYCDGIGWKLVAGEWMTCSQCANPSARPKP